MGFAAIPAAYRLYPENQELTLSKHVFFVTCPKGVEYLLGDELESFGLTQVRNAPAGVWVEGELEAGYRACMWSRLANRVILHIAEVDARSAEELYEGVVALDWQAHIPAGGSFRVNFLGQNEEVRNTQFGRSEEHTSELQSRENLVCRLLLEKKKKHKMTIIISLHFIVLKVDCQCDNKEKVLICIATI